MAVPPMSDTKGEDTSFAVSLRSQWFLLLWPPVEAPEYRYPEYEGL